MLWDPELIEGFFDETSNPNFRLHITNIDTHALAKEAVIAKGTWAKRSISEGNLVKRSFFLTKRHLYYKKTEGSNNIRGILNLEFARVVCEGDELEENGEWLFKIKFIKNLRYF